VSPGQRRAVRGQALLEAREARLERCPQPRLRQPPEATASRRAVVVLSKSVITFMISL